jgi:SH3-like domain-containing protein
VEVFVGLGFPIEISTMLSAFELLNEWTGSRGVVHQRAIDACRAALAGTGEDAHARSAFIEFARDRDILAPEALANTARQFADEWMGS